MRTVEGFYEQWRQVVFSYIKTQVEVCAPEYRCNGEEVDLSLCESNDGIIQSRTEREI
ncbi:hypothetical protein BDV32DRAFT_119464 [Aspergillus pseudonomiae]|nr:hypothetical protein BDV32DRAFT_119464 [Aspergillus pseudonomiae]